jgi:hypothetical protein
VLSCSSRPLFALPYCMHITKEKLKEHDPKKKASQSTSKPPYVWKCLCIVGLVNSHNRNSDCCYNDQRIMLHLANKEDGQSATWTRISWLNTNLLNPLQTKVNLSCIIKDSVSTLQ